MNGPYEEDGVDLLTSDFGPDRRAFARRLTTALRLLASDASGQRIPSASVHPARALAVLEERRARRAFDALMDIAQHGLRCELERSFVQVERPARDYTEAWLALGAELPAERRLALGLALPAPDSGARALLEALKGPLLELAAPLGALAQARAERLVLLCRVGSTPERDLRIAFEALAKQVHALPRVGALALRRALLLDRIGLGLDARRLADLPPLVERVSSLPERIADCTCAQDALALFARWVVRRDIPFPRLVGARAEDLGVAAPDWTELGRVLAGGAPDPLPTGTVGSAGGARGRPGHGAADALGLKSARGLEHRSLEHRGLEERALDRRALGASAVCVLRFGRQWGPSQLIASDCAPGLRDSVRPWLRGRRDALRERGAPEHEVVRLCATLAWAGAAEGAAQVLGDATIGAHAGHAAGSALVPGALLVVPLVDARGEVGGVLWAEFDHPLIPSAQVRAELARVWQARLEGPVPWTGDGAARAPGFGPDCPADAAPDAVPFQGARADGPLASSWARAVEGLQLKLAERRWAAFERSLDPRATVGARTVGGPARFREVATGGDGDLGERCGGIDRWLARVHRTGGTVRYGEEEGTALFAHAVHGVAIPVRLGGRVVSVLVIETARRGDLRPKDVERWEAALEACAGALIAAMIDARDRSSGFAGVALDPSDPATLFDLPRLVSLGMSSAPLCLLGPVGSGRSSLARALAHVWAMESGGAVRAADAVDAAGDVPSGGAPISSEDALVVRNIDRLEDGARAAFCRRIVGANGRLLLTASGERPPALARGLGAATVRVAGLRARRTEVVPIARSVLRTLAARGRDALPGEAGLREDGAGVLFRQRWEGGCGELVSVLATARLEARDGVLDQAAIERALAANGIEVQGRLPSREPDPQAVAAALWCTRTSTERVNKARASAYLGWDPATLGARMKDLGLGDLAAACERLRAADRGGAPGA